MIARYGREIGQQCIKEFKNKALDRIQADRINRYLAENWESFAKQLRAVMLPSEKLWKAMKEIGAVGPDVIWGCLKPFIRKLCYSPVK